MNRLDESLQKLLHAASRAKSELPQSAPFALETRVIAHWRGGHKEDDMALLLWLFRRAMIFAVVIMMLSIAFNYFGTNSEASTTALANYAMMQFPP